MKAISGIYLSDFQNRRVETRFQCDSDRIEFAKALLEDCEPQLDRRGENLIAAALANLEEIET